MLKEAIKQVIEGSDLTREQARAAMDDIMSGNATDAQIGGIPRGHAPEGRNGRGDCGIHPCHA